MGIGVEVERGGGGEGGEKKWGKGRKKRGGGRKIA